MHGFLSPKNCLFGKSLLLKIADLRFASFFKNTKDNVYCWRDHVDVDKEEHLPDLYGGLNYLSPEYIEEGITGQGGDFWGLGCIIFYMLTGKDPFPITTREDVMEKIMSGVFLKTKYIEEENFGPEAYDLILKLTQMDVDMRLGCGKPGSPQHLDELKNHPWFKK